MTGPQARAELAKLGTITLGIRIRTGPFESDVSIDREGGQVTGWSTYSATASVRVSRDVTIATGGYGDTTDEALDALVANAQMLARRHR